MKLYKSIFSVTSGRCCIGCGAVSPKGFVSNGGYNYYCTCEQAKLFAENLTNDPIAILEWPGTMYFDDTSKPVSYSTKPTLFAKKPNDGDKGDLPW